MGKRLFDDSKTVCSVFMVILYQRIALLTWQMDRFPNSLTYLSGKEPTESVCKSGVKLGKLKGRGGGH